jgi:hypothetical protein
MLKLPDITSELRTAATFAVFNVQSIFYTEFVSTFMVYPHAKFHMPKPNGSLVIDVKSKAKFRFCAFAILFYTSKTNYHTKIAYYLKIYYYQTFQDPTLKTPVVVLIR